MLPIDQFTKTLHDFFNRNEEKEDVEYLLLQASELSPGKWTYKPVCSQCFSSETELLEYTKNLVLPLDELWVDEIIAKTNDIYSHLPLKCYLRIKD